jgi:hypothetical protein
LLVESARGTLAVRSSGTPCCADRDSPQYAMMFGAGAVYHGIVFARGQLASHGVRGQLGAGIALANFVTRVLTGRAGTMFRRSRPRSTSTASRCHRPPISGSHVDDRPAFLGISPY